MIQYSWSDPPGQFSFPVEKAGYPVILACAFITAVLALLDMAWPAIIGIIATLSICFFFRDPDRVIPNGAGIVVSPADGKILDVSKTDNQLFYEGPCIKISIFMSVFNVHVNRVPHEGEIKSVRYFPGKFVSANLDKASLENEHNAVFLETQERLQICFVQVAGLIARRIICKVQEGDNLLRGQRFGLICFGSRLDVYLPADFQPEVSAGDKVQAGASILGKLI